MRERFAIDEGIQAFNFSLGHDKVGDTHRSSPHGQWIELHPPAKLSNISSGAAAYSSGSIE